uniref:Uncharacterized protein n=1 Tax=Lepeophtheirus salmonis TaxID=72036 RepID=A0A0K2TWS3_LEPSM
MELVKRRGHRFHSDKILIQVGMDQPSDSIKSNRIWIDNSQNKIIYTDRSKDGDENTGA